MKNKILPAVAVLVLVLAAASIARTQPRYEKNDPPAAPPSSPFAERVAAAGLVEPSSENISIASHLPGVVEKVFVQAGQEVKRGDALVKLDTRALEAALAEASATLATRAAAVQTAQARALKARASLADVEQQLKFAESVTDQRSISAEDLSRRQSAVSIAKADVQSAEAEVRAAESAVAAAEAALRSVRTDLERSTVAAPIDGRVLQVRIRPGEFAPAGPAERPWLVLGDVSTLHVRVDIDEHEAWRIKSGSAAVAQVRGNASLEAAARFVRFEPLVVPKQSLTGSSSERVDTRVLQAIYKLEPNDLRLFPGQQMDVFIEAAAVQTAALER